MRLASYYHNLSPRLGAVLNSTSVVDLAEAYAAVYSRSQETPPVPLEQFPRDIRGLLDSDERLWKVISTIVESIESDAAIEATAPYIRSQADVKFGPIIGNPSKIICIGLNYRDHCLEQGIEEPTRPLLFAKFPSAIIGTNDSIRWPADLSDQVDFEGELAIIIKKTGRDIAPSQANDYIAGYTILNDVSARDVQFSDGQWVRGKSFDTFCPIGPYLVTPDEIREPHELTIRTWLNDELVQDSNTREMIFKIPELLAFVSKACTLYPGDVIATGTPDGVGVFRKPPRFLNPGDTVEVEIERLGRLSNPVSSYTTHD